MARLVLQLVTWNGAKYIPHLFSSLREQTLQDWDLVVIDNGSKDETVAFLERELENLSQFRTKLRKEFRCQFIRNAENRGFAGGHNQALRVMSDEVRVKSQPEFVQLLNQDTVLAPEYLEQVLAFMERTPTCGAAQGALLRWDFSKVGESDGGRTDTIDTLGLRVLRNRRVVELHTGEQLGTRQSRRSGRDPDTGSSGLECSSTPVEVFGVSGALPMYRTAALRDVMLPKYSTVPTPTRSPSQWEGEKEKEVFDEDFFSYKEDVDLAFRLRSAGWSAYVVPSTRAWHDRTVAGPQELSDAAAVDLRRAKSPLVRYHSYKNHMFVLIKNEHAVNFALHWPWVVGYEIKKLIYVLLREPETFRALRDVCAQLPAMRAKRRAIMAQWRVPPAEVRRWFR